MLAIVYGLVLGLVHFFSKNIHLRCPKHRMKISSFLAGIFITYLFLHIFPMLYEGTESAVRVSLVWALVGFSLFHLIEKYVYAKRKNLRKKLKKIHSISFFIYHFVIGMVLVNLLQQNVASGTLFFIPLLLFTALTSISLKEVHIRIIERSAPRLLLSASSLFGILLATYVVVPGILYHVLFGFVVGTALHIILMDAIPKEREGRPEFFVLGVIVYTLLIYFTWVV